MTGQRTAARLALFCVLVVSTPSYSRAGRVGADINAGGFDGRNGIGIGTSDFYVYSHQTSVNANPANAVGPNHASDHLLTRMVMGTRMEEVLAKPVLVPMGKHIAVGNRQYRPILEVTGRPKPPAPWENELVISSSGALVGRGEVDKPTAGLPNGRVAAVAFNIFAGRAAGSAAASVHDPWLLGPGTYDDYLFEINGVFDLDPMFEIGGMYWMGYDSRFADPLWELLIDRSAANSFDIKFTLNEQALQDGVLTDAFGGLLDKTTLEAAVEAAIALAITPVETTYVIGNFTLFGGDFRYVVDTEIEFGYGTSADILAVAPVPEASFLALCALGIVALAAQKRRKFARGRHSPHA